MTTTGSKFGIAVTLLAALGLSACNSSSSAIESKEAATAAATEAGEQVDNATEGATAATGEASLAAKAAEQEKNQLEVAKVINKPGTVSKRGGHIPIIVNNQPITNFDIQRRAKFLQLRRVSGNRTKLAQEELIEQTLKLQEARARRVLATDEMVEQAFANFAKSNRATPAIMSRELAKLGVGANHFKEFIRTQISWQRAVQGRFRAEATEKSERDVVTHLRRTGTAKPEVTEYNLKQIIFVVPENKRSSSLLKARRAEAATFSQRFPGCVRAVELAKALRDVSIVDRNRIMEPELPENWKDLVPGVALNKTTRPVETARGIELMAVCGRRDVTDDRAAQITVQSDDFASFNEKGDEFSKQYLAEIKQRATIVYR